MRLSEISEKIENFASQGDWLDNAFDVWNETEGKDAEIRLQALVNILHLQLMIKIKQKQFTQT